MTDITRSLHMVIAWQRYLNGRDKSADRGDSLDIAQLLHRAAQVIRRGLTEEGKKYYNVLCFWRNPVGGLIRLSMTITELLDGLSSWNLPAHGTLCRQPELLGGVVYWMEKTAEAVQDRMEVESGQFRLSPGQLVRLGLLARDIAEEYSGNTHQMEV